MGELSKPERATYYVATGPGGIVHTGLTEPGQVTTTGQPSFSTATEEDEYLSLLDPIASDFPALPSAGSQLEQGQIYLWGEIAVMVRQSHVRTEHDPETVPALFIVHRLDDSIDWIAGEQVYVGTQRLYAGVLYEALQAHVTQADWTPLATPALWKVADAGGGGGGEAWVDTGATVTGQAGQLFYVSADISTLGLTAGQAIRLGPTLETTYAKTWPGTTTLMQISPFVTAAVGMKVWKWS